MQVIAKVNSDTYICQVSHTELEKFLNLYYGKMPDLRVGETIDLGKGYDYQVTIVEACKRMADAMESFKRAQKVLTQFALMMAAATPESDKGA